MSDAPYLSMVLTGRNDGYGGDFLVRFVSTLRFNHRELALRGVPHEFVIVEWAPPEGSPSLLDVLERETDPDTVASVRLVSVDPMYHDALTHNPRLVYHEFLAKNIGIRRSRGTFVLTSNCDVFLGRHVLDVIARRALDPGVVYRAARYDLEPRAAFEQVDWAYLEDVSHVVGRIKPLVPPYFARGSGDFILLDREGWEQARGFNEIVRGVRIGIDRNFLVQALAIGLRIVDIGGPVYHVNHEGSFRLAGNTWRGREWEAPWGDERWHAGAVVYQNPSTWGLVASPTHESGPGRQRLSFSWEALPDLVSLSGVRLPSQHAALQEPVAQ